MAGNRAGVNTAPSVKRMVSRLSRVLTSIEKLDADAADKNNARVYRKRCSAKADQLRQEVSELNGNLSQIRAEIEEAVLA